MSSFSERSFVSGELTPAMWSRIDTAKYQNGLKTARNGIIMRQGGFTNRPGTAMINTTRVQGDKVKLIPFVFSNSVSYVLEFGNEYIYFYKAGARLVSGGIPFQIDSPYVTVDLPNIQFVQTENVMYISCKGYPPMKLTCTGDLLWTFAAMNFIPVSPAPKGNPDDSNPNLEFYYDSTTAHYKVIFGFGGVFSGVIDTTVVSYNLPWAFPALNGLVTPGANNYPGPGPSAFLNTEFYMVTATDIHTGLESLPIEGAYSNFIFSGPIDSSGGYFYTKLQTAQNISVISSVTLTNPLTVTVSNSLLNNIQRFNDGDLFTFASTGMTELDGKTAVGTVAGNVITFYGIDATSFTAALSGASTLICLTSVVTALPHTVNYTMANYATDFTDHQTNWYDSGPLQLRWKAPLVAGNYIYNVYKKAINGLWGFMGSVSGSTASPYLYVDDGATLPDTSKSPPIYKNNFIGTGGFPSVIGVYQQRLCLANSPTQQENFWASNTGNFEKFTTSAVIVDSDTVEFQIAGKRYNPVTQIIDNGNLLIFTESGEFSCLGDPSGALTPTSINLRQQAFYGGTHLLPPIAVGKNVLYMQTLQSKVRELLFNYYINGYSGTDITIYANHLFDGHSFVDWAYQQEPNSIIWMVRDDGVLLSLTYIPEQQILAWTRHDTAVGTFENVCAIPEGNETALYFVVNRTINGSSNRYVERMASRNIPLVPQQKYISEGPLAGTVITVQVPDVPRSVFMDCSSYYDGRNTTATNLTVNPGGDYNADGAGFFVGATQPIFTAGMVGNTAIMFTDPATGIVYRCAILAYNSNVGVLCRPDNNFPISLVAVLINNFSFGINAVSGLDYLDGQVVSVLGDGAVLSSPANPQTATLTVTAGSITLSNFYAYVRVGLPYFTDMRTLDIDNPQAGATAQDKEQQVNRLALYVQDTRGVWGGEVPPINDAVNPLEGLTEFSIRNVESLGMTPDLHTGIILEIIEARWSYGGNLFIRQVDPLPMTVLSVVPAGLITLAG